MRYELERAQKDLAAFDQQQGCQAVTEPRGFSAEYARLHPAEIWAGEKKEAEKFLKAFETILSILWASYNRMKEREDEKRRGNKATER